MDYSKLISLAELYIRINKRKNIEALRFRGLNAETKKEKLEKEIKEGSKLLELEELISGSEPEENEPNRTKEDKREIENLKDQLFKKSG